ncbi:putative proton-dependent oligopeptide transporter family, major facilitator superfamily [Rosa chinensis]|uniref:Putative proton-dependent oligopeptide transporter family, major facilitator superfamily n=1 Tax=Rosa chinensis TaxID=74649 RepID=A0A2P6R9K2_ROSCH|nr:protein NRT1/ PTR FAMILY 2.8 [Rosa chinensis]XP_024191272.1 protein NRT1/ PTR FAMILY 2.8 [Rosa chinensis]PRQ43107.1 putative proton-dependent oligopeptide transporter family, major facilitator superfamily [Rosa chinensis]
MEEGWGRGENAREHATMHSSSPPKQLVGGWKAVRYILGNETFEKLASMSLVANLVLYLHTKYNLDNVVSANVYNIWSGSCNVAPLIGAYLADTLLGKYSTLLYSSIASLMGMVSLTLTASLHELTPPACNGQAQCEQPNAWQKFVLFSGLGLLVIGSGGLRPCNIAFGADQFDTTTEKGRAQLDSFCNWWYFLFTIALIVALTGVVYIQTHISWVLGFAIPAGCFALSILIFLLGRKLYIRVKPQGSTFGDIMRVIVAAFRKFRTKTSGQSLYDAPSIGQELEQILAHTERFEFLDKAAVIVDPNELDSNGNPKSGWRLCSVQQVERLKCVIALLPVCISGIGCFIGMQQMPSFGTFQAIQTNKKIGNNFEIPPAWMFLTQMIALSIWIIIYECIYIPWIQKRNNDESGRLTMETRFKVGIVMSILCMVVAGLTEMKRRNSALENGSFESPITVALLVPQFALSGLIEAFAAIALMELLTTQWPKSMRTFAGAVFFLSLSIASYFTSILVSIVKKVTSLNGNTSWLGGNDLNKNRLDYYYYTIAGLGVLNLLYFQFIARHFLSDADGHDRSRIPI